MNVVIRAAAFLSVSLASAMAFACPGYDQAHPACAAFSQDVGALSFGVLIGVASIAVQSVLRRR